MGGHGNLPVKVGYSSGIVSIWGDNSTGVSRIPALVSKAIDIPDCFPRMSVQPTTLGDGEGASLYQRRQVGLLSNITKTMTFSRANTVGFCCQCIKNGSSVLSLKFLSTDTNSWHMQPLPGPLHSRGTLGTKGPDQNGKLRPLFVLNKVLCL